MLCSLIALLDVSKSWNSVTIARWYWICWGESLRVVKNAGNDHLLPKGIQWAIASQADINTEALSSRLGVVHGAVNPIH